MAEFVLQQATREAVIPKILLAGCSGSGKTLSALMLAYGMIEGTTDEDWADIVVADTENKSAKHYVNAAFMVGGGQTGEPQQTVEIGRFTHVVFDPPYHPDRWLKLIAEVIAAKKKILILDSLSHEWDGDGGVLDWNRKLGARATDWAVTGPAHQRVLDCIRRAPIPIIACLREEQKLEITKVPDGKGGEKTQVVKLGLKPKQREGTEYEFDIQMSIDHATHCAVVGTGKDRTGLFSARIPAVISPETGRIIANWAKSGEDPVGSRGWVARRCKAIAESPTMEKLVEVYGLTSRQGASLLTDDQRNALIAAKDAAKLRLGGGVATLPQPTAAATAK